MQSFKNNISLMTREPDEWGKNWDNIVCNNFVCWSEDEQHSDVREIPT